MCWFEGNCLCTGCECGCISVFLFPKNKFQIPYFFSCSVGSVLSNEHVITTIYLCLTPNFNPIMNKYRFVSIKHTGLVHIFSDDSILTIYSNVELHDLCNKEWCQINDIKLVQMIPLWGLACHVHISGHNNQIFQMWLHFSLIWEDIHLIQYRSVTTTW